MNFNLYSKESVDQLLAEKLDTQVVRAIIRDEIVSFLKSGNSITLQIVNGKLEISVTSTG